MPDPVNKYRLNMDILAASMSATITAFDREAETIIGLKVDELIHISSMENRVDRVQTIFDKNVGVDALFEFKPTNYEMNNKDIYLTARKIVKKIKEDQSGNIQFETEESIAFSSDPQEQIHTDSDSVQKGNALTNQAEEIKHDNDNHSSPRQLRTAGRKGSKKYIIVKEPACIPDSSAKKLAKR